MSTLTPPQPTQSQPALRPHRFTVAEYHCMIAQGILSSESRVELLEGQVIDKMPHNPPHDAAVTRMQRRLARALEETWLIRVQCAISLRDSQPEPDLTIVAGPEETYFTRHPGGRDVALLIEVADTSLELDREYKSRLYARARVPIYWIANLVDSTIEIHTRPRGGRSPAYQQLRVYSLEESVPLVLAGQDHGAIPVRELLPASSP